MVGAVCDVDHVTRVPATHQRRTESFLAAVARFMPTSLMIDAATIEAAAVITT